MGGLRHLSLLFKKLAKKGDKDERNEENKEEVQRKDLREYLEALELVQRVFGHSLEVMPNNILKEFFKAYVYGFNLGKIMLEALMKDRKSKQKNLLIQDASQNDSIEVLKKDQVQNFYLPEPEPRYYH